MFFNDLGIVNIGKHIFKKRQKQIFSISMFGIQFEHQALTVITKKLAILHGAIVFYLEHR